MRHIINGCRVNLRGLSQNELAVLTASTEERLERVQEELDSLKGEAIRRETGGAVIPFPRFSNEPLTAA